MNTLLLAIDNVTKTYPNGCRANANITIGGSSGQIIGLVGPNGSGKTTLVRQILGLLRPTEGKIHVLGQEMPRNKRRVIGALGYVPQMPIKYPALTPLEIVSAIMRMKGNSKRDAITAAAKLLDEVGLGSTAGHYAYQLSYGSLKLMNLAMALSQDPDVLVLDEPTSMVDLVNCARVRKLLASQEKRCIFLTSHDLAEVGSLCDQVHLMANGRVIAKGTPNEISEMVGLPVRVRIGTRETDLLDTYLDELCIERTWTAGNCDIAFGSLNGALAMLGGLDKLTIHCNIIRLDAPAMEHAVMRLLEEDGK